MPSGAECKSVTALRIFNSQPPSGVTDKVALLFDDLCFACLRQFRNDFFQLTHSQLPVFGAVNPKLLKSLLQLNNRLARTRPQFAEHDIVFGGIIPVPSKSTNVSTKPYADRCVNASHRAACSAPHRLLFLVGQVCYHRWIQFPVHGVECLVYVLYASVRIPKRFDLRSVIHDGILYDFSCLPICKQVFLLLHGDNVSNRNLMLVRCGKIITHRRQFLLRSILPCVRTFPGFSCVVLLRKSLQLPDKFRIALPVGCERVHTAKGITGDLLEGNVCQLILVHAVGKEIQTVIIDDLRQLLLGVFLSDFGNNSIHVQASAVYQFVTDLMTRDFV